MKQIRRRAGHIVWLVTITLCATIFRLAHELACRPSRFSLALRNGLATAAILHGV